MKFTFAILFLPCCFSQIIQNAASAGAGLAPGALASLYGAQLASVEAATDRSPRPPELAGIRVAVTDSSGQTRPAGLLFVSPAQINLQIPPETALGEATFQVLGGPSPVSVRAQIVNVAPAIFSVDPSGIAAATAVRVEFPSLERFPVEVYRCAGLLPSGCDLSPIRQGVDSTVYISLFATGIRDFSSLANVTVNLADQRIAPAYAGPALDSPGEERIDFPLPRTLHGDLKMSITVDDVTSNAARLLVH